MLALGSTGWHVEADAYADLPAGNELASVDTDYCGVDRLFAQAGKLGTIYASHGEAKELAHANGNVWRHEHHHSSGRHVDASGREISSGGAMEELKTRRQRVALVLPAF